MKLGGLIKSSMIDYPGKISCVVFTQGCNFHCPYCHNPDLIGPDASDTAPDPDAVLAFLNKRIGLLDGVVVSGGEPTLQKDLVPFLSEIKAKGFSLKLDTNGSRPDVLKRIIDDRLVDYIAMDIKTSPDSYSPGIAANINPDDIIRSIRMIMGSDIRYEFRTTCVRPFVDESHIRSITNLIKGASRYAFQEVCQTRVLSPDFFDGGSMDEPVNLEAFRDIVSHRVTECLIR